MVTRRQQDECPPLTEAFRSAWGELRSDYAAGSNSRFRPQPRGVRAMGSGADYHYRTESQWLRMIERSRFFDRDNMVVGQGVNRLVANVIQDGFTLDVQTGRKSLDRELAERWQEWAGDPEMCDFEGEKTFRQMEQLAFRHVIVDGDILALPLAGYGSLQMAEAHRLRTPSNTRRNVVHGVHLDDNGRRIAYWVTKQDLDPYRPITRVSEIQEIKARDETGQKQVFHIYDPRRVSQRRGVTAFAPSVDAIGMHDDIQFAHLVKAQVASCFAIFESIEASAPAPGGETVTGSQSTTTVDDGSSRQLEGVAPGMRVRGAPGVRLEGFSPNIPNPEFFPHATLILTFIAINLDLPVAVLLLDPSNTNFSGWRGAIDQARMRFRQLQVWMRDSFHKPVYRWKVRQWIADNERLAEQFRQIGPAMFRCRWNPPSWRYIEPVKDTVADDMRVTRNLVSQRRRAAEQGIDWDEESEAILDDRLSLATRAYAKAQKANKRFPGLEIDWREIAYGHQSSGLRLAYGDLAENQGEPARAS